MFLLDFFSQVVVSEGGRSGGLLREDFRALLYFEVVGCVRGSWIIDNDVSFRIFFCKSQIESMCVHIL